MFLSKSSEERFQNNYNLQEKNLKFCLTISRKKCIIFRYHAYGPVVQLVRALACHARGRGFEPHPGRHISAVIAQSVERILGKDEVGGSKPPNSSKSLENIVFSILFVGAFRRENKPPVQPGEERKL